MSKRRPRLYLFDLDGTLVHDYLEDIICGTCGGDEEDRVHCPTCRGRGKELIPREGYPYENPVALPHRRELLAELAKGEGVRFGICTNQAGAALGYCTRADTHNRIAKALAQIGYFGGAPLTVQIAWDHPSKTTDAGLLRYRKPEPGMLTRAMSLMGVLPQETIFVGDRDTDRQAAERAHCEYADAEEFFH